ncbi:MAG: hypothetical protein KDA61_14945, partial [Planctomycetales bacterium]|nr:hypothetical protein [Planctomycetales bacterium]
RPCNWDVGGVRNAVLLRPAELGPRVVCFQSRLTDEVCRERNPCRTSDCVKQQWIPLLWAAGTLLGALVHDAEKNVRSVWGGWGGMC